MLSYIAPHPCFGCGILGQLLCDNCKYDIISEPFVGCVVCGSAFKRHGCLLHQIPFQRSFVVGPRSGALQLLIGSYKFRFTRGAAHDLVQLLDLTVPRLPINAVLVPIPTALGHIRERGYDHLAILGKLFAKKRDIAFTEVLRRHHNETQHSQTKQGRIKLAEAAFSVSGVLDPDFTYIVFDDIMTTGATVSEAALRLYEAGARTVWLIIIARQLLDSPPDIC